MIHLANLKIVDSQGRWENGQIDPMHYSPITLFNQHIEDLFTRAVFGQKLE